MDRRPPVPLDAAAAPRLSRIADRRGLTTAGAAVVMLAVGLVGVAIDVSTGPGLRTVFAVFFVLGCALAAVSVHREHLRSVVVMPPLVYAALSLVGSTVEGWGGSGSFLKGQLLELVNAIVLGAPVLVVGFLTTLVVALLRGVARRSR